MTKDFLIKNCMHCLLEAMRRRLEYEKKLQSKVADFKLKSSFFKDRVGWHFVVTMEDKQQYGCAIDLKTEVLPLTIEQADSLAEDWSMVFKHVLENHVWSFIEVDKEFEEFCNNA